MPVRYRLVAPPNGSAGRNKDEDLIDLVFTGRNRKLNT